MRIKRVIFLQYNTCMHYIVAIAEVSASPHLKVFLDTFCSFLANLVIDIDGICFVFSCTLLYDSLSKIYSTLFTCLSMMALVICVVYCESARRFI